jgi:pimeloyl-ACP methyl ester carboxylesterase
MKAVAVFPGTSVAGWLIFNLLLLLAGCSTDTGDANKGAASSMSDADRPDGATTLGGSFTHHTANVNGVRLHYVLGGHGDPVVLIHGFPETWYTWRGVMPALAEEHTVIAVDLRGAGASSIAESGYDKETMAEDVYRLIHKLGFEKVSVVGHDLGAWVAYAYAREHREEVSHLVFMGAALPGFTLDHLLDFRKPGHGLPHLVFFMQREVPETLIKGQERYYLTRFIGGKQVTGTDALDRYVRAYSRPGRFEAALNQYRTIYQDAKDNRKKAMPKLKMPVLALDGGGGPGQSFESMRRVAENVEGSGIEGAGHFVQEEQPERLADRLLDFLG